MGALFVYIPTWLIIINLVVVLGVLIFAIFIVPAYILATVAILKMFCYWSKTKRIDPSKLSNDQKKITGHNEIPNKTLTNTDIYAELR